MASDAITALFQTALKTLANKTGAKIGNWAADQFLSLILHEPNSTKRNVLYFRGKKFCEFFLNGQGAKVRDVERYK